MDSFISILAICKQCRARLSDPGEKDDSALADPKSQGEKQRDESQEHFEQCTEISDLVSKQNSITVGSIISRHLGVCVCVAGGGGGGRRERSENAAT